MGLNDLTKQMNQSYNPQKARSAFLNECNRLSKQLKEGAGTELTGDPETDQSIIEEYIAKELDYDPQRIKEFYEDANLEMQLICHFSDLSKIKEFDDLSIAILRELGTKVRLGRSDSAVRGLPLSISITELVADKAGIYSEFLLGPTVARTDLIEVVSLLRQIGQDVIGTYDEGDVARIFYKPIPSN